MRKNTVIKVGKRVVSLTGGEATVLLDQLLTVNEAAEILRCSKASLDKWRLNGAGPAFIYVGRRVRYARTALADFIVRSTRRSTSDPGEPAAATAA
jgi:hypothetical protein